MSGPAATPEFLESRRKAQEDQQLLADAERDIIVAGLRAQRELEVMRKVAPLNKRILHSRLSWRKRRAAAKRAKQSRRWNRV